VVGDGRTGFEATEGYEFAFGCVLCLNGWESAAGLDIGIRSGQWVEEAGSTYLAAVDLRHGVGIELQCRSGKIGFGD